MQAHPFEFAVWASAAALGVVAILLFLFRAIPQNLTGEAFYDFQYPYRYPLGEAWRVFFLERIRSRLIAGVFISLLYHLIGYNPPLIYLTILLLLIGTAVVIVYCLRRFVRSAPWAALLVVAFSLLPLNVIDLMSLKKAHHVLAWFAFWLAVLFFQRWVASGRLRLLTATTLSFLAAVLAYEAPVALLPVAAFLSLPMTKTWRDFANKLFLTLWITVLVAFAFLNLEAAKPYSGIENTYTGVFDPGHIAANIVTLLPELPSAIWNGALFADAGASAGELVVHALLLLCGLAFAGAIWMAVRNKQKLWGKPGAWALLLAALWLGAFTYIPFLMAGQGPDGDGLRGAAIGLVFIFMAFVVAAPSGSVSAASRWLLSLACLASILLGVATYNEQLVKSREESYRIRQFVVSMRTLAPDVAWGTNFVFVNSGLGRTGCIGIMNMLYDQGNLHCIHLLDGDTEETYTRTPDGLVENELRLWPEDFVILTLEADGTAKILGQLGPAEYPLLPITWESSELLVTDFGLILSEPPKGNMDFYNYTSLH